MTLETYLTERLGEAKAKSVLKHAKMGETIVFHGPPGTGKTTMTRLLRMAGYKVMDDWERIYEVTADKPLEKITPHGFIEANF